MVRRFGTRGHDKNEARAQQIWQILVSTASGRRVITYKILAKLIGYKGAGVLGNPLAYIAYWCKQNNLPPLTSLVVNDKTGLPGKGIPVKKAHTYREQVYKFPWFKIIPPTREELSDAYKSFV